jgi:transcriptional regulator with XRE-family HTH domain
MRVPVFADYLRYLIQADSRTQAEIGAAIGVNGATVSRWCCGTQLPDTEVLAALMNTLGLTQPQSAALTLHHSEARHVRR